MVLKSANESRVCRIYYVRCTVNKKKREYKLIVFDIYPQDNYNQRPKCDVAVPKINDDQLASTILRSPIESFVFFVQKLNLNVCD